MKYAFHQILISLLEQWPKCISLFISLTFIIAMVTKMAENRKLTILEQI